MPFDKLNLNFRQHSQRTQSYARTVQLIGIVAGANFQLLAAACYEPQPRDLSVKCWQALPCSVCTCANRPCKRLHINIAQVSERISLFS